MVGVIKTQWDLTQFFPRPVSTVLAAFTVLTWFIPLLPLGRVRPAPAN